MGGLQCFSAKAIRQETFKLLIWSGAALIAAAAEILEIISLSLNPPKEKKLGLQPRVVESLDSRNVYCVHQRSVWSRADVCSVPVQWLFSPSQYDYSFRTEHSAAARLPPSPTRTSLSSEAWGFPHTTIITFSRPWLEILVHNYWLAHSEQWDSTTFNTQPYGEDKIKNNNKKKLLVS